MFDAHTAAHLTACHRLSEANQTCSSSWFSVGQVLVTGIAATSVWTGQYRHSEARPHHTQALLCGSITALGLTGTGYEGGSMLQLMLLHSSTPLPGSVRCCEGGTTGQPLQHVRQHTSA